MTTTLLLQNIKCNGCTQSITAKLNNVAGVTAVELQQDLSTLTITHTTLEALTLAKQSLIQLGYPPVGEENSLLQKAKSFVSCATGKLK